MTERIGALFTELADIEAPPVPTADPIWRRAGRTRIRRRAALAVAAVALGSAALTLTLLSGQPSTGPADPPTDRGAGDLEPLPPRLTAPIGEVPMIAQEPTDRIQLLVESDLYERLFFVANVRRNCLLGRSCADQPATLGIGSDHGYRYLVDPRRGGGQLLLAPDGEHAAMLEPVSSDNIRRWRLLDLRTGRTLPAVECDGVAGWIRDGAFVCIPGSSALVRYRIDSQGGVSGVEIDWSGRIGHSDAAVTPALLGPSAEVLLAPGARPGTVTVIDRQGRTLRTIRYPEPVSVAPISWCGPDSIVVSEPTGPPTVIGFDGVVRSTGRVGWSLLGCRPDGSILLQDPSAAGLWLMNPDGTAAGELRLPRARPGTDGPSDVVAVAIAFDWRVAGSAARVHGFRPLEWVDEAALVLVVVGGVGLFVRRRRKRRMAGATGELA